MEKNDKTEATTKLDPDMGPTTIAPLVAVGARAGESASPCANALVRKAVAITTPQAIFFISIFDPSLPGLSLGLWWVVYLIDDDPGMDPASHAQYLQLL